MRSRRIADDPDAEVARRRLALLSAELAEIRRDSVGPSGPPAGPAGPDGSGEPFDDDLGDALGGWPPAAPPDPRTDADLDPRVPSASAGPPGRHAARPRPGATQQAAGWVHDRLPATLQGRLQLGASHLTVVALVVAVALAVTAYWALRAGGAVTAVPRSAAARPAAAGAAGVSASSSGPASPGPRALVSPAAPATARASAQAADSSVVVDVAGKVRDPGIATLPAGSRVVDALAAAGGVRKGVRLTSLNLARVLVDGEQILVGVPHPRGVAASAAGRPVDGVTTSLVNINTADETMLETLPSVGPVTAAAIIKWRTTNGAFTSVDELLEVSGIGDATLAEIAPFVTV
ncbi:MAG TPA: helix-hairpin-helix domain-containing protein [Nocardioidaceae bacterium]|nr:helix-hairpin-helix domain-containing protein [Nocardioidaceae bacterium]